MTKIEWKYYGNRKNSLARAGALSLSCRSLRASGSPKSKWEWMCRVKLGTTGMPFGVRLGKWRKSLAASQREAEKIAEEFIIDIQKGLKDTVRYFGLDDD